MIHFCRETTKKIYSFQNGKHGYLMQYLIRQSFEGYCWESELKLCLLHFKPFRIVECRLPEEEKYKQM